MRYLIIEDRSDVSVYKSFGAAVLAVEPIDVPRVKLFDELGNEYPLSVGRKEVKFLGLWSRSIEVTVVANDLHEDALELEGCLRGYASRAKLEIPSDAGLPELVETIAMHQHT